MMKVKTMGKVTCGKYLQKANKNSKQYLVFLAVFSSFAFTDSICLCRGQGVYSKI